MSTFTGASSIPPPTESVQSRNSRRARKRCSRKAGVLSPSQIDPFPQAQCVTESATSILEIAQDDVLIGEVLGKHGGDRKSEEFKSRLNKLNLDSQGVKLNSHKHIELRLEQDRPDLYRQDAPGAILEAGRAT